MTDDSDGPVGFICATCGRPPDYECRAHFTKSIREAIARAEAAEKRCAELEARDIGGLIAERNAACAEAERAEAACAQMRRAVASARSVLGDTSPYFDTKRELDTALASDCGKGWVSSEQHAEVVRERDARGEAIGALSGKLGQARAQLAEVMAQAAVMREALSVAYRHASRGMTGATFALCSRALSLDAGKALVERVKLLEAVAEHGRGTCAADAARLRHGRAPGAECRLKRALAALDAHDKQNDPRHGEDGNGGHG